MNGGHGEENKALSVWLFSCIIVCFCASVSLQVFQSINLFPITAETNKSVILLSLPTLQNSEFSSPIACDFSRMMRLLQNYATSNWRSVFEGSPVWETLNHTSAWLSSCFFKNTLSFQEDMTSEALTVSYWSHTQSLLPFICGAEKSPPLPSHS